MAPQVVDASWVLERLGRVPIVDVRTPAEYAAGHIPGAIDVPLSRDAPDGERVTFLGSVERAVPDKSACVVVYCRSGVRAREAAEIMDAAGYGDVRLYRGSWLDWMSDPTRPVER